MSFLKSLGKILAAIVGVVSGMSGAIAPLLSKSQATEFSAATGDLSQIVNMTLQVEASFAAAYGDAKTGPQKVVALAANISPILADIDQLKGRPIVDQQAWAAAAKTISGGFADLLNSYQGHA
jgi:hypothetical protein